MYRLLYFPGILILAILLARCVDPVEPAFQFEPGFLFVEGQIADFAGQSEVRVTRSEIFFDAYNLVPVDGAIVTSIDGDGNNVDWSRVGTTSTYVPPEDFAAVPGQSYYIRVMTPSGEIVESSPEVVPDPVPVSRAELKFEQEAYFSDARSRFIPAFRLLVDFQDPGDSRNYYQWKFRSFERQPVCAVCRRSVYRDGVCIETPGSRFAQRYDYLCDTPCWTENRSRDINILSDEFSQGARIENIETGRIDFDWYGPLLVEVRQLSTTKAQYEYNAVLKDLSDGSGGLNATLPAALIGNMRDVDDLGTNVLGFVGAVSVATERVFINRDTVDGSPLPFDASIRLEPLIPSPPSAPCIGANRRSTAPPGWPE